MGEETLVEIACLLVLHRQPREHLSSLPQVLARADPLLGLVSKQRHLHARRE